MRVFFFLLLLKNPWSLLGILIDNLGSISLLPWMEITESLLPWKPPEVSVFGEMMCSGVNFVNWFHYKLLKVSWGSHQIRWLVNIEQEKNYCPPRPLQHHYIYMGSMPRIRVSSLTAAPSNTFDCVPGRKASDKSHPCCHTIDFSCWLCNRCLILSSKFYRG